MENTLTDEVITIKPYKMEDAESHLQGEDEEQVKWLSRGKGTIEGVREWIKRNQDYWNNDGPVFNFAIFDPDSKLVGMVEANEDTEKIDGLNEGDANISYVLYPFARGRGYAFRAVNLITQFLKDRGIKNAVIRIDPVNASSLKVPQRCGFEENGLIIIGEEKLVKFTKKLN